MPLTYRVDTKLQSLLQALLIKANIEALIGRVEAAYRKEIWAVKIDVQVLSTRLTTEEATFSTLDCRVSALKTIQNTHTDTAVQLQFHLEDRSRRNNLRLRGLPETTGAADLADTAIAIFKSITDVNLPDRVELDRIHRVLGPVRVTQRDPGM